MSRIAVALAVLSISGVILARDCAAVDFARSVRALERLQDAAAQGDQAAENRQARLLAQIETDILNGPAQLAADGRTLKAAVVFVFSGGNPNILEKRLPVPASAELGQTYRGALAYARADRTSALKVLASLDPTHLPAALGGRVAIMRAVLNASSDISAALKDLRMARRLMPGTLVEEAALRRCIAFSSYGSARTDFDECAKTYVRRFSKSAYWNDFTESVARGYVRLNSEEGASTIGELKSVIEPLSASRARPIALAISRSAVLRGQMNLAEQAAAWAQSMALAGSRDMERAKLYQATSQAASAQAGSVRERLLAIDVAKLDAGDRELLSHATRLQEQIVSKPKISVAEAMRILPPSERKEPQVQAP
jgi:chemotaxis protein MotC